MTNLEQVHLTNIRRLAGLDPDGSHKPMQPYLTEAEQWLAIDKCEDKVMRDLTLVYALRFT